MSDADDDLTVTGEDDDRRVQSPRASARKKKMEREMQKMERELKKMDREMKKS